MDIIHLSPDRWSEYREIYLEELLSEPQAHLTDHTKASQYPECHWRELLEKRGKDIYFAEVDGKIIGMAGISFGEAPKNNHVVSIWGVYIKPKFRGKGFAKELLSRIIEDLLNNPLIIKVSLGVVTTQTSAKSLYESLGFEQSGYLKKELLIKGEYFDEYLMEKILR